MELQYEGTRDYIYPMNNEAFELIPDHLRELDVLSFIATMAMYEHLGYPIMLKNGSEMSPEGFKRFSGYG